MANFSLLQGDIVANLSEVQHLPAEGFQVDSTWQVSEEVITAESDKLLKDGPAVLLHDKTEYPITVAVLEFEKASFGNHDDELDEPLPLCQIEIDYARGLPELASALGLS